MNTMNNQNPQNNNQNQPPYIPPNAYSTTYESSKHSSAMSEEEKEKRAKHFSFFSIGSIIYAVFYTFCLYKNSSGITYPFFIGGTLFYFFLSLKKLEISAKKDSIFYIISLILLGVSTFCTDNVYIHFMNKAGIFVLALSMMIHNFCMDKEWEFVKYLFAILELIFGSIGSIFRPFTDFSLYLKSRKSGDAKESSKVKYVFWGILISIPLIIIVLSLLVSADAVFDSFISSIFENIQIPENWFGITFTIIFAFFASYSMITFLEKRQISKDILPKHTREPVLAITITSILSVIYMIFCGIQIMYLFWGNMELPYGYTYAEYARQGFFQLMVVCLINLLLVLICLNQFKESKILKVILTIISLCTYIMIASSAMRMIIYIKFYYLTFLRIFVLWSLFVIFLLITGVLATIYKSNFPLFKYSMIVVTVLYIVFSFSHVDYFIAKCNVSNMEERSQSDFFERSGYSDIRYLQNLSADAAPILINEYNSSVYTTLSDSDKIMDYEFSSDFSYDNSWQYYYISNMITKSQQINGRNFNLSRAMARGLLIQNGVNF